MDYLVCSFCYDTAMMMTDLVMIYLLEAINTLLYRACAIETREDASHDNKYSPLSIITPKSRRSIIRQAYVIVGPILVVIIACT